MADDITNIVLLRHIQAMKSSLEEQIAAVDQKADRNTATLTGKIATLTGEMQKGFEEARQHREALQEDLEATICMLAKHEAKLARL